MLRFVIVIAFSCLYKTAVSDQCGYNVTASSGSIQSPHYPSNYDPSLDCYYTLTTPPGTVVLLEFVDFYLESCCDYVYIYDGPSTTDPLFGTYGYQQSNVFINGSTNQILVRFTTDGSGEYRGFNITFHINACINELTGPSGSLQTVNFPSPYTNNQECFSLITTSTGTYVELAIVYMNLESCCDFIKIYDGSTNSSKLLGIYTGQQSNVHLKSSSNQILVYFYADSSISYNGFDIAFAERENCEQEMSGTFGSIVTQGYPVQPYANDLDCYYKISTTTDTAITITIVDMDLEPDYDYIEIYDGFTTGGRLIGSYTGVQSGVITNATTNEALIYFHTDSSVQSTGFFINFEESAQEDCPASNYITDSGILTSPSYNQDPYLNNLDCYNSLKTSENTKITFHVNHLDVELSNGCDKDFVELYDGPTVNSPLLAKLCGTGPVHDIMSSTNEVMVYFHSDNDITGSGFSISFNTNPCPNPIEYTGDFGTIYSPGYPQLNYPNFADCKYSVMTPTGTTVHLTVTDMNLEFDSDCSHDYVRIYDGSDEGDPIIAALCGNMSFTNFQANTNKILIEFHSDESLTDQGFSIIYSTE